MTFQITIPRRIHGLEDDDDVVRIIKEQASINGFQVEIYETEDLFLESIKLRPDIVFIDWSVSNREMKGNSLAAIVREMNPDALIIMFTGHSRPEDILYFYNDLECFQWIVKGIDENLDIAKLTRSIQKAMRILSNREQWMLAQERRDRWIEMREANQRIRQKEFEILYGDKK